MLSLLSLLLASGTVLKADTDEWTAEIYPDPRTNSTLCNTWVNSTLCDPDHMLTDYWRQRINDNILAQMERLNEGNVQYADRAPISCLENRTEPVKIYVLLAKRIHIADNQTITEEDLTNFGNELTRRFGLDQMSCKNFLLLIGVEAAKLAYVRTGKDLKLPPDLMQRVFHEYNAFNAKNYMEGLNKIVDEIGTQLTDPFKDLEELIREYTASPEIESSTIQDLIFAEFSALNRTTPENESLIIVDDEAIAEYAVHSWQETPWLILIVMTATVFLSIFALLTLWMSNVRRRLRLKTALNERRTAQSVRNRFFASAKKFICCRLKRNGVAALDSQQTHRTTSDESLDISSINDSLEAISDGTRTPVQAAARQLRGRSPPDGRRVRRPSVSLSI